MRRLKVGVAGCGVIGRRHILGAKASPRIELTSIADPIEERVRELASAHGVPRTHAGALELIRDPEVEAVVLAISTGGRAQLAAEAFRLGKHVLLEKPPAMNAGEILELMAIQGERVGACCSARFKFLAGFEPARAAVASGRIGAIREIYVRYLGAAPLPPRESPPVWRVNRALNGGGILVNWGSYDLDYLLSIAGWTLEPRSVFAQTWRAAPHLALHAAPGSDAESHYVALIRCAGGEVIHLERSEFSAVANESAWQIIGTHGSLRLRMEFSGEKTLWIDTAATETGVTSSLLWQGTESETDYHHGPVQDFAEAVLDGRPPRTDLRKALVIQRLFDAIYESADTGELARIPEM